MQKIIILGITGSVGTTALHVLKNNPEEFNLTGFSYHSNFQQARDIAKLWKPLAVSCTNSSIKQEEIEYWKQQGILFFKTMEELLSIEYDAVLVSVVGSIGALATKTAADQGKRILLANKESLIMAGSIIMESVAKNNAVLVPVDSEHSSLFRLLHNSRSVDSRSIKKLILTASGGPFRTHTPQEIMQARKEDVLKHPTWNMGHKITVDSASMVNKALELMEASHLFGIDYSHLDAVIHSKSLVHAILQYNDGSHSFHVSHPDMFYPVAHALYYPHAAPEILPSISLADYAQISFETIDPEKYPAFFLGKQAGAQGGIFPSVFNAANEKAVSLFLEDKIRFQQIPSAIDHALNTIPDQPASSLQDFMEIDQMARDIVSEYFKGKYA